MELLVGIGIGVIIDAVVVMCYTRTRTSGILRLDTSDPNDGPYLFLELTTDLKSISKKKHITFEISTNNYISQEKH